MIRMRVNRVELLNELKKITKIIGGASSSSIPIIKGVLIEYSNDKLKLSATNIATSLVTELECDTDMLTDEIVVVDAKLLHDIISKIGSDDVDFEYKAEESVLNIKGGKSKFNIKSLGDAKQFPEIEGGMEEKKSISIPSDVLINLVNKTIKFTSDDDTRITLTGVNLVLEENSITGVSLDGYRMGYYKAEIENDSEKSMIVDANALANIARSIDGDTITLSFSENSKKLEFVLGKSIIYTSEIEGQFFKYKDILKPEDALSTITMNTRQLKNAVERANLMSRSSDKTVAIVLSVDENSFIVNSESEYGKVEERVDISENEGEKVDYRITFNPRFVLDGLNSISSEDLEFKLNSSNAPAYLLDKDNGFIYLMLPIRTREEKEETEE
jgi:DNA polymerase-3 subunit beta